MKPVKHYCYEEDNAGMAPCTAGTLLLDFIQVSSFRHQASSYGTSILFFFPKQLFPNFVLKNSLAAQQVIKSWEGT